MPAYNANKTLKATLDEVPSAIVDDIVLVDDCSSDDTAGLARNLGVRHVIEHLDNLGYGGNQKSCYAKALELDADIIIMLHPDYQYTPKLITAMASLLAEDIYDCVLGSRILSKGALEGGMPLYKYIANRFLTFVQNIMVNQKLSEYHTGYRAFSKDILENLPLEYNSDDFLFDNQMLVQIIAGGFRIGEISCPTRYSKDSSSISFFRSVKYGLGVFVTSTEYFLHRSGIKKFSRYTMNTPGNHR